MPVSTLARVVIVLGLALGLAGDALLNVAPWGLGVPIWIALAAAGLLTIVRSSRLNLGPKFGFGLVAWLGVAAMFAWRDSHALKAFNVATLILVSGVVLLHVQPRFSAPLDWSTQVLARIGGLLWRGFDVLETWVRTRTPGSPEAKRRAAALTRGTLLVLPVGLVFGGLLMSADAAFDKIVTNVFDWNLDVDSGISHLLGAVGSAWVAMGLLSAPGAANLIRILPQPTPPPPQFDSNPASPAKESWRIGLTEVGFVMGTLALLFGAFVLVQFRYFFGGAGQVQGIAGLSYAEYARKGFFELVWVIALAAPVLLACGKVCLREGALGHRLFVGLGSATVGMLFVIMVSAWSRMSLYVDAYGLTALRFYVCASMVWIGAVLVWMIFAYSRKRPAIFAPGAAALGVLAVLTLNALNPDGRIAAFNLERARTSGSLDAQYLTELSLDAGPELAAGLANARATHQEAIRKVLAAMEARLEGRDWRSWNWGEAAAERAFKTGAVNLARR